MKKPINPLIIIIIITLMGVMAQFASDNYIPSMPAIGAYFHVQAEYIKLSITFYLFGMGGSQLFYGPLSDFYGRKPIILIGFGIFFFASLLAALASHINFFLYARLLQGIGMGSAVALYRAILRDISSGEKFAKITSYIMVIVGLTPPLAPITGGYIQQYFGWRHNFLLVSLLALIIGSIIWLFLPETLASGKRKAFSFYDILETYKQLFMKKIFMLNAICSSVVMSTMIIYVVVTAFLYQQVLGLTPVQYGWLTVFNAAMMMVGGILNAQLIERVGINKMIDIGIVAMIVGAAVMLMLGLFHLLNVLVILLPMMLIFICVSIVFVNFMTLAFNEVHQSVGTAGALYGGLSTSIIAIISVGAAYISNQSQIPMATLLLLISLAVLIIRIKCSHDNIQHQ
jgi:DHA1 family bicyclomycin/chloramphenicol resistance-like MFS transporter/DHA1 family 2-module integral membrane pump EmrD-like MFS transporter